MTSYILKIDGSHGEGGGQILRTSLTLSALLQRPIEIFNIRSGRKNPGLQPQHLTSVNAIEKISKGRVENAELGSKTIRFYPDKIEGGDFIFDVSKVKSSAGSTGMIFQTIAPVLSFTKDESKINLIGGTHAKWAPPIDYISNIFIPIIKRMNLDFDIEIKKWGWFPKGGGMVEAKIKAISKIKPILLEERGKLLEIKGISVVSNLPTSIAERQSNHSLKILKENNLEAEMKIFEASSIGAGSFVMIIARFENSISGSSSLGERGKPAEKVAEDAVRDFLEYYHSGYSIDPHLADQLILYTALADGRSNFSTSKITNHLLTNIWVTEQFIPVKFQLEGKIGERGKVTVDGIGFKKTT